MENNEQTHWFPSNWNTKTNLNLSNGVTQMFLRVWNQVLLKPHYAVIYSLCRKGIVIVSRTHTQREEYVCVGLNSTLDEFTSNTVRFDTTNSAYAHHNSELASTILERLIVAHSF